MAVCYHCDQVMFIGLAAEKSKQIENDIAVDPSRVLTALTGGKLSKFLF